MTVQYSPTSNLASILTQTVAVSAFPASKDVIFTGYRNQGKAMKMSVKPRCVAV